MPTIGTVDINRSIIAWADIVLDKFEAAIINIPVVDTGALRESLHYTLFINAGSDIDRVEFSFKLYGIFADAMAGKNRIPQKVSDDEKWFSKRYFAQVMRLKEILMNRYGTAINYAMFSVLSAPLGETQRTIEIRTP